MARIQEHRFASLTSPLGEDALLFLSLSGTETLSEPFSYELELLSEDSAIDFKQVVGKDMTLRLNLHDGSPRYFNGYVSRFVQTSREGPVPHYTATLVPWLWFLTRNADCRIFQNKKPTEIIQELFQARQFTDFVLRLQGDYPTLEYCVQYRETDFNFVSRLMEQFGIYYYFEHSQDKHTLVLCDAPSAHQPFPGFASLDYRPGEHRMEGHPHLWQLNMSQEVETGKFTHNDYDFKMPRKSLRASGTPSSAPGYANSGFEVYDYPGLYDQLSEGETLSKVRIDEQQAQSLVYEGRTDLRAAACGYRLSVAEFPREDCNQDYLISGAKYSIQSDEYSPQPDPSGKGRVFTCDFTAITAKTIFRPQRVSPKPAVKGPQTALVVGPAGQEYYVDDYGRIKVQFYWDRVGEKNEKSSCFIRVGQPVAGKRWGGSFWPRIGQEVIVAFLEGDPDQPLIVGSVYNGDNKPPYLGDGPDSKHPKDPKVSGFKTNSTPGGEGFNELRFDDTKGKEQVFIHAQRNMDQRILNDSLERVYGNRHTIIGWNKDGASGGDRREMIYRDQHTDIKRHQIEHVEGNLQLLVGKGEASDGGNVDISIEKKRTETIGKDSDLHIKGARNEKIDAGDSTTVGADQQIKVGGKHAVDATSEIHLKAGMKVVIEAGIQLTIKAAGGFIDIGPAGVTIQGTMVLINSGGAAGSGSGASPTAPADAREAQPTKPDMADDSVTGQKTTTMPPPPPPPDPKGNTSAVPGAAWSPVSVSGNGGPMQKSADSSRAPGMAAADADAAITQALKDQVKMLEDKKAELQRWDAPAQANFTRWFGSPTEANRQTMLDRIDKQLALNKKLDASNFHPVPSPDDKNPDLFAQVSPDNPHRIELGQAFASSPATGANSRAGTLCHEMSHFTSVGGTDDLAYGEKDSLALAKKDPASAMNNADNFEFYCENQ